MTDLFEKCLKNAEPVQEKMDSNMMEIRHLDAQFQIKENEAKQKLTSLVKNWKKLSKDEQKHKYEAVVTCLAEAKELCNQKINLSSETYEMVDGFIQKLDSDTAKFNTYMQEKTEADTATTSKIDQDQPSTSSGRKRRGSVPSPSSMALVLYNKKGASSLKRTHEQASTSAAAVEDNRALANTPSVSVSGHGDMPVDPNEPRYCLCQQVSFGNMVGCDNKNCPLEWFHFSCVGLTSSPRGKWYCPQCRDSKEGKKQTRKTPKSEGKNATKDV